MEILTSLRRLYIRFKSLVNDFVYSFGRAALLLLVEVQNHTVPVQERRRIRVNPAHTSQIRAAAIYLWRCIKRRKVRVGFNALTFMGYFMKIFILQLFVRNERKVESLSSAILSIQINMLFQYMSGGISKEDEIITRLF